MSPIAAWSASFSSWHVVGATEGIDVIGAWVGAIGAGVVGTCVGRLVGSEVVGGVVGSEVVGSEVVGGEVGCVVGQLSHRTRQVSLTTFRPLLFTSSQK